MLYNKRLIYYIMMNNCTSNNNPTECQHPSNKVTLADNGEYICTACGAVLTLDEAVDRNVYARPEVQGYIDPKGKTNPWLLGIGSVIPKSYYAKIAKSRKLNNEDDSTFANIISELALERYGQELMDMFHAYSKSRSDYAIAAYIAVMNVVEKYELQIDPKEVIDTVNKYFKHKVRPVPTAVIQEVAKTAKRLGAKRAYKVTMVVWE